MLVMGTNNADAGEGHFKLYCKAFETCVEAISCVTVMILVVMKDVPLNQILAQTH